MTFFSPNTQRLQPLRQEGVVDTFDGTQIEGYTSESRSLTAASTITVTAVATATGTATVTITVNPLYYAFAGQNVRTLNVAIVNGDAVGVIATKIAAAIRADMLLSGYFTVSVSAGTVSILAKQIYDADNNLTAIVVGGALFTSTVAVGALGVAQVEVPVGRLVYTASGSPESAIRVLGAGASGVLRGVTCWTPDAGYDIASRSLRTKHFYYQDVCSTGVINLDNTVALAARTVVPHVVSAGANIGKVVFTSSVPNALPLDAVNFPNISNIGLLQASIFELPFSGGSIYKLRLGVN